MLRDTPASRMTSSKLMWSRLTVRPALFTRVIAACSIRRAVSPSLILRRREDGPNGPARSSAWFIPSSHETRYPKYLDTRT
ncbi:hypothetical protein Apa02nite_042430 [Actinoplanes palleronii]|uniref:Secreted protein n=1 Tax=Actinoplanes palleronii TaxID=113570 RepID=A0ABQ4BBT0_9ACTN|nr:hypothetical protein Apa02nite_042430 [Actinoplanes palleronii]